MGLNGSWTIDPDGFTIAPSGGNMTGAALTAALANGNMNIQSTSGSGTDGNVNVDDAVSWSANRLALTATHDVNINAVMTATGTASLDLAPGSNNVNIGLNADGTFEGRVDFSGSGTLRMNVNGTLQAFTVINSLGTSSDSTSGAQTLQGLAATAYLSGNYVLGSNIDASATGSWRPCSACSASLGASHYGFASIGTYQHPFAGTFDGLGHVISGLAVNRPDNPSNPNGANTYFIGLFGYGTAQSTIRNVGLQNVSILGGHNVGGLIGWMFGNVSNSFSTGTVIGKQAVGGLVGTFNGSMNNVYSSASVSGRVGDESFGLGGLVGYFWGGSISNSHATGPVSGGSYVGGLVGLAYGSIANSYATGSVTASGYHSYGNGYTSNVGGLAGFSDGATITGSHATGNVTGAAGTSGIGGLLGNNYGNTSIDQSYAVGNVSGGTGSSLVGGLVGNSVSGSITHSHATGSVSGGNYVGGLVGSNGGTVGTSYATGNVTGADYVGGLVGTNVSGGIITTAFATGVVAGSNQVGGFAGSNSGTITDVYSTGAVSGTAEVGGLVGQNTGAIDEAYAAGGVTGSSVGGLVGTGSGTVTTSFWDTTATGQQTSAGGTGMTTAQMQQLANFSSATSANGNANPAWDFAATWVIYSGSTYPLLQFPMTPLTVTANNATKTYDGLAFAGGAGVSYSATPNGGLLGTLSFSGNSQGAINAGSYVLTPTGLYSNQYGYDVTFVSGTLSVAPRTVNLTGTSLYSGTTVVPAGDLAIGNLLTGQSLTLSGSGTIADANVSSGPQSLGLGTLTLGNGASGLASNYTFIGGSYVDTVVPAPLTVVGSTVASKVYDGTTVASLTGGSLSGVIGGGIVTLTQSGTFASKNVGTGIAVTASDGLSGSAAGDYTLVEPTGLTGSITPAPLTVNGTTVADKVYDGTTVATLTGGTLAGLVSGDVVTLTSDRQFRHEERGHGCRRHGK